MKRILSCLVALVVCFPLCSRAAEKDAYHMRIGDMDVWILSTAWREQSAQVLLPVTAEHKKAIDKAYPDGSMRNTLNVMLVRGKGFVALVDTGLPATLPGLLRGLAKAKVKPEDVTHVILTHAHGDHVGGLTKDGKAVFPKARVILSEKEYDFWTNPDNLDTVPERAKVVFTNLPDVLRPYAGKVERVVPEHSFLPGISMVAAYGHTPGHVGVVVREGREGREGLLFWGDMVHGAQVQLRYPDIATTYDVDLKEAIKARKALVARAAKEGWQGTGVHMPDVKPRAGVR